MNAQGVSSVHSKLHKRPGPNPIRAKIISPANKPLFPAAKAIKKPYTNVKLFSNLTKFLTTFLTDQSFLIGEEKLIINHNYN